MIVTIDKPNGESVTLFSIDAVSIYKNEEGSVVSITHGDGFGTMAFSKGEYGEAFELYHRIIQGVANGTRRMKINWKNQGTVARTVIYFVEYEGD